MRAAVQRILDLSDPSSQNYATTTARFFSQTFPLDVRRCIKAWAIRGRLWTWPLRSRDPEVVFFYDQIFAKEPGAGKARRAPDLPFLPMGRRADAAHLGADGPCRRRRGAIHYLRGSHRWETSTTRIGFKTSRQSPDTT